MRTKIDHTGMGLVYSYTFSASMILILVSLAGNVSMNETKICIQRHAHCIRIIQKMMDQGIPNCSISLSSVNCLAAAVEDCSPYFSRFVKSYKTLVEKGCQRNSNLTDDITSVYTCLQTSNKEMTRCTLDGEFNTLADVCSSFEDALRCRIKETKAICAKNSGRVNQKLLKPIVGLLNDCKHSNISVSEIPECGKRLLRCVRHILTGKSYTCSEIQKMAKCSFDAVKSCNSYLEQLTPLIKDYMKQIPEYCDPESPLRKSLKNSYVCILTDRTVRGQCHEKYNQDLLSLKQGYVYRSHQQMLLESLRLSLEQMDCIARGMGSECGREAEFFLRYIFGPAGKFTHEGCMDLSGSRCNSSFGQAPFHLDTVSVP